MENKTNKKNKKKEIVLYLNIPELRKECLKECKTYEEFEECEESTYSFRVDKPITFIPVGSEGTWVIEDGESYFAVETIDEIVEQLDELNIKYEVEICEYIKEELGDDITKEEAIEQLAVKIYIK